MSLITYLTKSFLTHSFKPFTFTNEYDQELDFLNCQKLGLYVHIPFCRSICNFCPYCKYLYEEKTCDKYIDALIKEIHMVGNNLQTKKETTSLYFGGGSPAIPHNRLKEIIDALNEHFTINDGIGIELHPDDICCDTLQSLKNVNIDKISIGIQSFSSKFQKILGRKSFDFDNIKSLLQKISFETVSMDLIFALPTQTFDDLRDDVDKALYLGANHIAIYPFIDFTFTKSSIKAMAKKEKRKLLDDITGYFYKKGFIRNSIWTFAKNNDNHYSSMTRENFLGFGCSATTLLKRQFKINTFFIEEYINRINNNSLPTSLTINFSLRQRMVYYLFWVAYSTQINPKDFEDFFGVSLKKEFGIEMKIAKMLGFIIEKDGIYQLTTKGAFYYHYYENYYTLKYIDKMWGIMREEAFPQKMTL